MTGPTEAEFLESIQFRDWGSWHAVKPDEDRTFCGRSALGAKHMWQRWGEQAPRCRKCLKATKDKE